MAGCQKEISNGTNGYGFECSRQFRGKKTQTYRHTGFAYVGDVVTSVVKGASSVGTAKDHSIVRSLIVRTSKEIRRKDGSYIRFDDNAAILIGKDGVMVGTRVFGPVARELRDKGFLKIVSLAKEVW